MSSEESSSTHSSNSSNSKEIARRWLSIKEKISQLEDEEEELKEKLHSILQKNKKNQGKIIIGNKVISRCRFSREVIYKKNVPSDIWKRYCKELIYYTLRTRTIK